MRLPVLALFTRSLRLEARQARTYLLRVGLLVFVLCAVMSAHASSTFLGAPGLVFFTSLIMINFFFITLVGLGLFASAITEEKEEMTLGLLRMTSLSPLAILFGKSTSRVLSAILLLAAQFPFTILSVTLGGVSMAQIVAAYCTLLAYIIMLSNVALLCSVVSRRTPSAVGLALLFLLVFFFLPPLGNAAVDGLVWAGYLGKGSGIAWVFQGLFDTMIAVSPFQRLTMIIQTGFSDPPVGFQVLSNIGIGIVFFLLSWALFDLFTRQQKDVSPPRALLVKRTSRLRLLGAGRAWSRALAWKDFYFLTGGIVAASVKFLVVALAVAISAIVGYKVDRACRRRHAPVPGRAEMEDAAEHHDPSPEPRAARLRKDSRMPARDDTASGRLRHRRHPRPQGLLRCPGGYPP
jgi:hypothetical protein